MAASLRLAPTKTVSPFALAAPSFPPLSRIWDCVYHYRNPTASSRRTASRVRACRAVVFPAEWDMGLRISLLQSNRFVPAHSVPRSRLPRRRFPRRTGYGAAYIIIAIQLFRLGAQRPAFVLAASSFSPPDRVWRCVYHYCNPTASSRHAASRVRSCRAVVSPAGRGMELRISLSQSNRFVSAHSVTRSCLPRRRFLR